MNPTFGSLFAGVGGFDLGFEAAGYDCKFQVEWDKHCQQVLGYHWPDVPRWSDVSDVNGAEIPPVDVITYGFPCQDLSVAGKRAGLDGDRSNLFFEAIRIITEMREATNGMAPTFAVAENVVGLLNADGGSAMARCLDALAEAGAVAIEWCVLDAQWFGVPQRRRRVFLTACFDSSTAERCPNPLFPVAESGARNPAEVEQERESVAALTANGVGTCGADDNQAQAGHLIQFRQLGFGHYTDGDQGSAVKARDYKDATDLVAFTKGRRAQTSDDYETWDEDRPAPTLNEFDNGDIRTTTAVVFDPSRRDGARPQLDGTCNTLTGHMGTGGNNTPMVAQSVEKQDEEQTIIHAPEKTGALLARDHKDINTDGLDSKLIVHTRAVGIQGKNIGRQDKNTTNGKGHTEEGEPMFTLTSTDQHAVAVDTYNQTTETEHDHPPIAFDSTWSNYTTPNIDLSPTVKVGSGLGIPSPPAVAQHDLSVRRLTPLECERLQGWPDNHTLNRADGKENSDSQRYKQCGNGVAAPVARWIAKHLKPALLPKT